MGIVAIIFLGLGFLVVFLAAMSLQRGSYDGNYYKRSLDEHDYAAVNRLHRLHVQAIVLGGLPFIVGATLMAWTLIQVYWL